MRNIYELEDAFKAAKESYDLMIKEYSAGEFQDFKKFNALAFAISNAVDELEKGLKGEF